VPQPARELGDLGLATVEELGVLGTKRSQARVRTAEPLGRLRGLRWLVEQLPQPSRLRRPTGPIGEIRPHPEVDP